MQMVDGRYHTRRGDDHEYGHDLLGTILRIAQVAPPADAAAYKSFVKAQIQSDKFRNFMAGQRPPFNVWANEVLTDASIVPATDAARHWQFPSMDRVVHRTAELGLGAGDVFEPYRELRIHSWRKSQGMVHRRRNDLPLQQRT